MRDKFRIYACLNSMYHIYDENKYIIKKQINVSNYIPTIIKRMIHNIPNHLNNQYIICPFYNNYYDYQIGITETSKESETSYESILRGINEETGLSNIVWNEYDISTFDDFNKEWYGVNIYNNEYIYQPNNVTTITKDDYRIKVAIIICNKLNNLLQKFINFKKGDIISDNINSLGLISVYDCKNIVNYRL